MTPQAPVGPRIAPQPPLSAPDAPIRVRPHASWALAGATALALALALALAGCGASAPGAAGTDSDGTHPRSADVADVTGSTPPAPVATSSDGACGIGVNAVAAAGERIRITRAPAADCLGLVAGYTQDFYIDVGTAQVLIASTTIAADGSFSVDATVPDDAPPCTAFLRANSTPQYPCNDYSGGVDSSNPAHGAAGDCVVPFTTFAIEAG